VDSPMHDIVCTSRFEHSNVETDTISRDVGDDGYLWFTMTPHAGNKLPARVPDADWRYSPPNSPRIMALQRYSLKHLYALILYGQLL
jgi:hypothetical protein